MAQPLPDKFIMSMNRVSKIVPPKRTILKDISLSFFPGAKIGVLGLNGSGKSTLGNTSVVYHRGLTVSVACELAASSEVSRRPPAA